MNKKELVKELSEVMHLPQVDCNYFLDCLCEVITNRLQANDSVKLPSVGRILACSQHTRPGRNPRTGEFCPVPARTGIRFKPSKLLLNALNSDGESLLDEKE